ncbi:hypothetical protein M408DRAFT_333520 [Serendipita vermifera MAFF 305830]|uniref:CHCH domain-containing protein n=1 Tax=Serendipita vermifera MAFF 305830 TaxID=933852 RepID=A0A0C3A9L4_SERVB|nr:hypothetical protein M408DRAFT_333520 [Serendipita vermifera MAFF 305830]
MPRSRGSSGRSSKPSAPAGTRSSSTAAAPAPARAAPPPPAQAQAGQAQPRQPGMLAQMAATAGSVAIGSTVGHGISHMLFGGRDNGEAAAPANAQTTSTGGSCEFQAKEFTKCLDAADPQTCNWFLQQLKECQAAAARY